MAGVRVGLMVVLAVLVTLLAGALSATATPSGTLVVSQVYGGGGNSGATYTNDFIEIFNPTSASVSVSGMSVQYASATGTGSFVATPLSGSVAPGQYYLVQEAAGVGGTTPLPTPDASGSIAMSATAGKVILASSATSLACNGGSTPCSAAQLAQIVDLVGYGSANFFEGAAAAPVLRTRPRPFAPPTAAATRTTTRATSPPEGRRRATRRRRSTPAPARRCRSAPAWRAPPRCRPAARAC